MAKSGQRARTGRALLALCGHRWEEIGILSEAEWHDLDRIADEHRLRPFLHGRLSRGKIGSVPDAIAQSWQQAHRTNGIAILSQRRALLHAVAALAERGIGSVALKGSVLAWTVWPAPAERVMRDIDLLVAEENAPRAYRTLRASDWRAPDLSEDTLSQMAAGPTHLPPLYSPEGVMCELHARIWGEAPLPGATMPEPDSARLLANARYDEKLGAAIPSGEDMLVHLVVHAACAHLLNVGPMALVDVDLWCARKRIDWQSFWGRARREGFDRAAALVFALVDRWRRPGFLSEAHCPHAIEDTLLDEAELLLVQDMGARKDVSAIASLSTGRIGGRLEQHPLDRAEASSSLASRTGQLASRAVSLGRSLLSPATRRDGRATARLQKWMES